MRVVPHRRLVAARLAASAFGIVVVAAPYAVGVLDARCDDGDAQSSYQRFVFGVSEGDGGLSFDGIADSIDDLLHLEEFQVLGAYDMDQKLSCGGDVDLLQQRVQDNRFCRALGTVFACGFDGRNEGASAAFHHRAYIGEIAVDDSRARHQVGDAAHAGRQDLVGGCKRLLHRSRVGRDAKQVLVVDDRQGVDDRLQLCHASVCDLATLFAFESERGCDDGDGENFQLLGDLGDHRSRARSCSAAHACGEKDHLRAL